VTIPTNSLRLARRPEHPGLAHNNSAISRLSSRPRRPRSTLDGGRADEPRSWGTQPPNMSMTHRRETRERSDRPASRNHINHHQPDNGQQPLPLDKHPSIWATEHALVEAGHPASVGRAARLRLPLPPSRA
jgi:hypothetical protein